MYYYALSILKKEAPALYKFLKKVKHAIFYRKQFISKINNETKELVNRFSKESYLEFSKRGFFKIKDSDSSVGILEINNSCNINCVMCDTKSSTRKKKLMSLDICEESAKQMKNKGIKSVLLHTIGDPLANAKLKDYLNQLALTLAQLRKVVLKVCFQCVAFQMLTYFDHKLHNRAFHCKL